MPTTYLITKTDMDEDHYKIIRQNEENGRWDMFGLVYQGKKELFNRINIEFLFNRDVLFILDRYMFTNSELESLKDYIDKV